MPLIPNFTSIGELNVVPLAGLMMKTTAPGAADSEDPSVGVGPPQAAMSPIDASKKIISDFCLIWVFYKDART